MTKKKFSIVLGVSIIAALLGILAMYQEGALSSVTDSSSQSQNVQDRTPKDVEPQAYRITTDCELVYALSYGVYPNDEKLPEFKIMDLIAKYPQEFAPWREIMEDPTQRDDFFSKPLPSDFGEVLVVAMMIETSISPSLKETAMIIVDPLGKLKMTEEFEEHSCQPYFDSRKSQ